MTRLEFIQDYKGHAIMIYRIVSGWQKGTRFFRFGNFESENIRDIKKRIDKIKGD